MLGAVFDEASTPGCVSSGRREIGAIGHLTTKRELFTSIAQSRPAKVFASISVAPF